MTDTRPAGIGAVLRTSYARVAAAPAVLAGAWLVLAATALPFALSLGRAIERDLGSSLEASSAATGVNVDWWSEFAFRHPERAEGFTVAIIGGAAPLGNVSTLLDGGSLAPAAAAALTVYGLTWTFLLGGVLERYARRRRLGSGAFFSACGVFVWRVLRLGILAAIAYAFVFGALHPWLFDRFYPWITRDLDVERTAFAWRVLLYAVFLAALGAVVLLFDYAKVRLVVEDRRSAIGALVAAARFLRRHPGGAATVFLANVAVFVLVTGCYVIAAPGAQHDGWSGLLLTLGVGQLYLLGRLAVKLAFYATAIGFFEQRLAHVSYTAPPEPVWPDSPVAEAIVSGARGQTPGS